MRTVHDLTTSKTRRKNLRQNSTPQEVILWSKLRGSGLGFKFRRQHSIGSFIVDFYCSEKKLIIEIDGSQHVDNKRYDEERSKYLEGMGYKVVRFWNNEINTNIEGVIMKIEEELNN